jgi:hypothetical protein
MPEWIQLDEEPDHFQKQKEGGQDREDRHDRLIIIFLLNRIGEILQKTHPKETLVGSVHKGLNGDIEDGRGEEDEKYILYFAPKKAKLFHKAVDRDMLQYPLSEDMVIR